MALVTADRVKETSTTTGTGAITLAGASIGYRKFNSVMSNGDTCYYCMVSQTGTEWEVGLGTYSAYDTLSRTTVHSSSNAASLVNFSAGTKDVFLALTASQFSSGSLPTQTGNSGKFLTTNGTTASWSDNPLGTVTQVQGTGTVNGITLTGNVTSSGNLTLGGALSGVNLGTQVTGTLSVTNGGTGANSLTGYLKGSGTSAVTASSTIPGSDISGNITGSAGNVTGTVAVTNGGTGTTDGSITGTGALTFAAGGTNQNITLNPSGTGNAYINKMRINHYTHPAPQFGIITTIQRESIVASGYPGSTLIKGANATANGSGGSVFIAPGEKAGTGSDGTVSIDGVVIKGLGSNSGTVRLGSNGNNDSYSVAIGFASGSYNAVTGLSEGRCVFIGYEAGTYQSDGATPTSNTTNSIYIGERVKSSGNSDTNAIAIGSNCAGEGSNTTVIGNTSTSYTRLHGYTKSKSLQETVFTITDGASVDINPANGGIQVWTLGANRTPTASSFAEGQSVTLMVDDGTAYAITWTSISPTWVGGSAPTLATSGFTVIELWKRSSTIYGALVGTV